jgi:hypothetical protein
MVFYNTMNRSMRLVPPGFFRSLLLLAWLGGTLAHGTGATAAVRADLFQATAPLTDRSEGSYTAAFHAAMRMVLVRVTGRRTAAEDPTFAPLVNEARRFVQQYRATPDQTLWVAFDAGAIERWLAQNGEPLWGRERPTTFVWLIEQTGPQSGTVVSQGDTSELKSLLDAAAAERGIALLWPGAADLQNNHLDYATASTALPGSLTALGHRLGGDGVLIGRASGPTGGASVRWTHVFQDRSNEFSGTLDGVERAADTYAELFATNGSFAPVDIEVSGVDDVQQYAAIQSYLESLTSVSLSSVEALSADTIRFRLSSRGGAEPLHRALVLNGLLEPVESTDGTVQHFRLRR